MALRTGEELWAAWFRTAQFKGIEGKRLGSEKKRLRVTKLVREGNWLRQSEGAVKRESLGLFRTQSSGLSHRGRARSLVF